MACLCSQVRSQAGPPDAGSIMQGIDRDRNGYVTVNELDDILKEVYPETFGNKNLKPYLKPYASIANPILLDYSKFRDTIQVMVKDGDQLTDT